MENAGGYGSGAQPALAEGACQRVACCSAPRSSAPSTTEQPFLQHDSKRCATENAWHRDTEEVHQTIRLSPATRTSPPRQPVPYCPVVQRRINKSRTPVKGEM